MQESTMKSMLAAVLAAAAFAGACGDSHGVPPAPAPSSVTSSRPPGPAPVPGPAVNLTGEYRLTFIAAPACQTIVDPTTHQPTTFPESARTRQYPARITQDAAGNVRMVLKPGECAPCSPDGGGTLEAKVSDRTLTFSVPGSGICAGGDYWWESLSGDREWFEVCGVWSASIDDPNRIAGTHGGTFAYHHLIDPSVSQSPNRVGTWVDLYCTASDHTFTLT